ncbi:tyrosinase family protein [Streptomyces sp. NBC_01387]|uniref:tyrosinase family protein n=1 Tax=unclassified Streptomyces TaxID=2593676 RepID=UPI002025057B|nr:MULTISPECIES: tyrosinase family protein [unclassified Streptomyces]MCX4549829.1 tyrosinase family protein [Streptomyces sp. NBC_01500]WSC21348.1 tyrosinase family protein [Streptomyces sp. NBC_01766]WSV55284.1 tyrosinase family protein [Streptomyces sp. NBC_01014]
MYVRKNQKNLTGAEKKRFVSAVLEVKRSGQYDDFVRTHGEYYVPDGSQGERVAHMAPTFFPWHRRFVLDFERALQAVAPGVTVPYWDWTVDNTPAAALWGDDFLGGDGRRGDQQVMTGPFAYRNGNWEVRVGVTDNPFLTRNFGRPANPVPLPTRADLARAMKEPFYDAAPWDSTVPHGFRNTFEGWGLRGGPPWRNHNLVHRWVGGMMNSATSPNDPVFWLHHSFCDLVWDRWQKAHPRAGFLPAGKLPDGDPQSGRVFGLDEPMPPWGVTPSSLMSHQGIYRYA